MYFFILSRVLQHKIKRASKIMSIVISRVFFYLRELFFFGESFSAIRVEYMVVSFRYTSTYNLV